MTTSSDRSNPSTVPVTLIGDVMVTEPTNVFSPVMVWLPTEYNMSYETTALALSITNKGHLKNSFTESKFQNSQKSFEYF